MQTKITHLIISLIFAVILWFMCSVLTIMIVPIVGYILTAIAKIMEDNFDTTIKILCWTYTLFFTYYLWKNN